MKIAKYKIVSMRIRITRGSVKEEMDRFSKKVEGEISMGWQPIGGVSNGDGHYLTQAMVKYY